MRCSARRSRAAATISIARVIFWTFLTDEMRSWTSRWVGMGSAGRPGGLRLLLTVLVRGLAAAVAVAAGLGLGAVAAVGPLALVAALVAARDAVGLALLDRLALLVEVVAEVVGEARHRPVEGFDGLVGPVPAGDLLQEVGVLGAGLLGETVEELRDLVHGDSVQVAVGGRKDLDHLVLDRHRAALLLVQRGHEPLAARQRALGVGVQLGAE